MKKIYSLATVLIALVMFCSCKKQYVCNCKITTVVDGREVNYDTRRNTIRAVTEEDAGKQCVYTEQEIDYLTQKAVVRNDCKLQ